MGFNLNNAEAMMNFTKLKGWVSNQIAVNNRLRAVCIWYLIFLMTSVRKHSLTYPCKLFWASNKSI